MGTQNPYSSFDYLIDLGLQFGPATALGGFQAASGLTPLHSFRFAGRRSRVSDVTLKRGLVNSWSLWNWITQARSGEPTARRDAVVSLRNESGQPVQSWKLSKAMPVRFTGPPLGGQSNEVAIEELVLSAESISIVPPV